MRRLLNLLNHSSSETDPTELPSLPKDLSFTELSYQTTRGYLARKFGQYLGNKSSEEDKLFYHSLSKRSFLHANHENQTEYLLYLSELMLQWHKEQLNMMENIKALKINDHIKNAMLKAYEIHKKELFTVQVPNVQPGTAVSSQPDHSQWEIYRDVMFAATQGQFLLISEEEVSKYKQGIMLCEGTIKERSDIPLCRNLAKECLEQKEFNKAKVMGWLLVLSEAITNTIKHAEEGRMILIHNSEKNELIFVIKDKGPGFDLKDLPKKTLLAGYSTKKSMGQGFTLMMKMSKKILLSTSPKGSTIILTFNTMNEKEGEINGTG